MKIADTMEKLSFVFFLRDDKYWDQLFAQIANVKKKPEEVGDIAVVIVGTAILSCLKSTRLENIKSSITALSQEQVHFYLCTNTLHKYGFEEEQLLPEIEIAAEGGLLKVAKLESSGHHAVFLG